MEEAGHHHAQTGRRWLQELTKDSHELESLTLQGLQILTAEFGLIRCSFIVPNHLSDRNGNWHVGAMTTLMDVVAAAAVVCFGRTIKASLDFNISYYSPVPIHEEVEIEAKAVGHREKLSSVVVKVIKKGNGELVALGRQWLSTVTIINQTSQGDDLDDAAAQIARKWLEYSSRYELEAVTLQGLKAEHVGKGLIRCNFIVPNQLSDKDGNWHIGAMAILIDDIAACSVLSYSGKTLASVDFSISYYSTAKIHEEVEIKAMVEAERGILISIIVEIRKRGNGEKIAVAKQWMSTVAPKGSTQKTIGPNASLHSKL